MTDDEFRKQMKELNWSSEYIEAYIELHRKKLNDGIDIPLEVYLRPYPEISRYPSKGYTD